MRDLDPRAIATTAADRSIADVVALQAQRARDLDLAVTPAFAIDGYGVLDYPDRNPSPASSRRCEELKC